MYLFLNKSILIEFEHRFLSRFVLGGQINYYEHYSIMHFIQKLYLYHNRYFIIVLNLKILS